MTRSSASIKIPSWVRKLEAIPAEAAQTALTDARSFLQAEMKKNLSKGGPNGLRVRTGRLIRSVRTYLKKTPQGGELSLGMAFYGWVHDRGVVIEAKTPLGLRFRIPGVGWRRAIRVVLPERRFARDALDATRKVYPQYLAQALKAAAR
ncbi:hypothetical protein DKM44_02305 [Deinococcus irradiatisoli]|uniref:Uncharacterized protein n=1 Tax=Deinococcus irradiatisoli TaxID=2202254 RepID=A0A2Z3JFS1_9DEIO|nr:hypothetical protein [Deinococcus irradiatisoli]AWN22210.1 hypothetical protein DKM44_02305 [Deinococcus irradiatisoli]